MSRFTVFLYSISFSLCLKKNFWLPKSDKNNNSPGIPFTLRPPIIVSYITVANDQNQETDIGHNISN